MFFHRPATPVLLFLICVAGCGGADSENPADSDPADSAPRTVSDVPAESKILRQEMVAVAVEMLQTSQPGADAKKLRSQALEMIEAQIGKIRETYPEFLIVSDETEERLLSGSLIQDSAIRIADAEKALREFGLAQPVLVKELLATHRSGTLSPRRTELLAQVIVGAWKQAEHAISN